MKWRKRQPEPEVVTACETCEIVNMVVDALCGKCVHEPLSDGCLKQTVCMKRGSVKRIFEIIGGDEE